MLYSTCYITYPESLYNIQVWLYNIQDGYITHPNLPDARRLAVTVSESRCRGTGGDAMTLTCLSVTQNSLSTVLGRDMPELGTDATAGTPSIVP